MNVQFFQFSKRINSTKLPSSSGTSYDCVLKEGSSIIKPRIGIKWDGSANPPSNLNYAYISKYLRFYYVSNWTYSERQWWADLTVDPLASHRGPIGDSLKYVLRSSSIHDPLAIDTMWNAKATVVGAGTIAGSGLGWANYGSGGGSFVVTVIGEQNTVSSNSVAVQYSCSGSELQNMIQALFTDVNGAINQAVGGAATELDALKEILRLPSRFTTDLSQYIKGIMWFPFSFPSAGGIMMRLGVHPVGAFNCLGSPEIVFSGSVATSGQLYGREKWECLSPYGRYWFYMEPFGMIEIDPYVAVDSPTLTYSVKVDSLSGLGILTLYADAGTGGGTRRTIAIRCAQIGVSVPYGSIAPNYSGAINLAGGVAAMMGNPEVGALLGGIGSAASMGFPSHSSGTAGGGAALEGVGHFCYEVFDHVDIDNAESGRPLCKTVQISSVPGYILCKDGDVDAPATDQELAQIKSYLEGGFYYE